MKLKRYLVFSGKLPACGNDSEGGWNDFVGSYDTLEEAHVVMDDEYWTTDWSHVVDSETGSKIPRGPQGTTS